MRARFTECVLNYWPWLSYTVWWRQERRVWRFPRCVSLWTRFVWNCHSFTVYSCFVFVL